MPTDSRRLTTRARIDLVAYLDGELDQVHSRDIETRLTESASARRELRALEQTWGLLDFLPRSEVSLQPVNRTPGVTRPIPDKGGEASRWPFRALAAAFLLIAGFGLGSLAMRWLWLDPLDRLARDLSIVEHLDAYRALGSLEELQRLESYPRVDEP